MSEIDPATPRNAPCPCGSGQKFKRCHGAEGGESGGASGAQQGSDGLVRLLFIIAVVVSLGIGVAFEPQKGLGVFGAAVIGIGAFAIFRNPPPPKSGGDDPAAINFGG